MTQSQSLARQQRQDLAEVPGRQELTIEAVAEMTGYTPIEMALISRTVAVGAPLLELAQFMHACKQLHLDPLLRQAYWIRRKNRVNKDGQWVDEYRGALQIGIDGFRALADRQGNYAGSEPAEFRGWKEISYSPKRDAPRVKIMVPELARVLCWKIVQGHKAAFTGEARWDEFYPGEAQGQMWHKMPAHQLAKCAEAQALRKGWPALLGSMNLDTIETPDGDLPEVGVPPLEVEPQRPQRTQMQLATEHARIFDGNHPDEEPSASGLWHDPDPGPEPQEDEAPANPQQAQALSVNGQLLAQAREAGAKGLGALTCNDSWPLEKIEEANKALQAKLSEKHGDKAIAAGAPF